MGTIAHTSVAAVTRYNITAVWIQYIGESKSFTSTLGNYTSAYGVDAFVFCNLNGDTSEESACYLN